MRYFPLIVFLVLGIGVSSASAHDGMLDSWGCHANVVHGSYHCHRGPLAGRQFRSREDMLQAYKEFEQDQVRQERSKSLLSGTHS